MHLFIPKVWSLISLLFYRIDIDSETQSIHLLWRVLQYVMYVLMHLFYITLKYIYYIVSLVTVSSVHLLVDLYSVVKQWYYNHIRKDSIKLFNNKYWCCVVIFHRNSIFRSVFRYVNIWRCLAFSEPLGCY